MRYKVPQKIDMEDRIVGPLTLAQFLYVMVGGMIAYALYQTVFFTNPLLFWVLVIPVGIITVSMAFLKIQEEPFPKFLVHTLLYLTRAKQRVWMKDGITQLGGKVFLEEKKTIVKAKIDTKAEAKTKLKSAIDILDK